MTRIEIYTTQNCGWFEQYLQHLSRELNIMHYPASREEIERLAIEQDGCRLVRSGSHIPAIWEWAEFDDEKTATLFLLRWA